MAKALTDHDLVPSELENLLRWKTNQLENICTGWLALLCRDQPRIMKVAVTFFFAGKPPASDGPVGKWAVAAQPKIAPNSKRTPDIEFRDNSGTRRLLVEAKVNDRATSCQINIYRDLLPEQERQSVRIVRLLKRPFLATDSDEADGEFYWKDLVGRIQEINPPLFIDDRRHVATFFRFLRANSVLDTPTSRATQSRARQPESHYDYSAVFGFIRSARPDLFPGESKVRGRIEFYPGTSPAIRLGSPSWEHIFGSGFVRRLWLYYSENPEPNYHFQIIFWHRLDFPGSEIAMPCLSDWATKCSKHNLRIYCPRGSGRQGGVNQQLTLSPPFKLAERKVFALATETLPGNALLGREFRHHPVEELTSRLLEKIEVYSKLISSFRHVDSVKAQNGDIATK